MDRFRLAQTVPEDILLVGLGAVWLGNWLWPGIAVVFGIAQGGAFLLRKRYLPAAAVFLAFLGIPILSEAGVSWHTSVPAVLIAIGLVSIIKAILSNPDTHLQSSPITTNADSFEHSFNPRSPNSRLPVQPARQWWK